MKIVLNFFLIDDESLYDQSRESPTQNQTQNQTQTQTQDNSSNLSPFDQKKISFSSRFKEQTAKLKEKSLETRAKMEKKMQGDFFFFLTKSKYSILIVLIIRNIN